MKFTNFLSRRNNHRYGHHLFTRTGLVMHLQALYLHRTRTCPIFTHEMWYNTKSSAANNVTERNWELVVQGLCVEKKAICQEKLMLIDTLFHASIFQETQSPLTDDGRTGRLGVAGGCTRGYLRHLVRKMSARTALTVQSLSPAH